MDNTFIAFKLLISCVHIYIKGGVYKCTKDMWIKALHLTLTALAMIKVM